VSSRLPRLAALTPDSAGWGFFLCSSRETRSGRSGSEFIILTLQDATGQVTAKLFDDVQRYQGQFDAGEFVRAEGRASMYNGQLQLVLSTIRRVNPDQDRLQGFSEDECVLSAPRPVPEMWSDLGQHVERVADPHLRVLLHRILADHEGRLKEWPAAQSIHHAYRGGFLEHVLTMSDVGRSVARLYGADEDLVFAGVLLHDIGKLQELWYEGGSTRYTREGNLLGHIAIGLLIVRDTTAGIAGFPDALREQIEHLILAHHGTREFGSPVEPKTVEAFILSAVDELDAKINQVRRAIADDVTDDEFTGWHKRLGRVLYKGPR
jgi:3'-5' exoribonuclease